MLKSWNMLEHGQNRLPKLMARLENLFSMTRVRIRPSTVGPRSLGNAQNGMGAVTGRQKRRNACFRITGDFPSYTKRGLKLFSLNVL